MFDRFWFDVLITIFCYISSLDFTNSIDIPKTPMKFHDVPWLPYKIAIPEHYVMRPIGRDKNIGLSDGFLYGDLATIEDLWQQVEKNSDRSINPISGCFIGTLSFDVAQKDASSFSKSDNEIYSELRSKGASSIKIKNLYWNQFPVKALEFQDSKDRPGFIAWIGMNTGGEAMKIYYMCPKDSASLDEERKIWHFFIHKSSGNSNEEILKKMKNIDINSLY